MGFPGFQGPYLGGKPGTGGPELVEDLFCVCVGVRTHTCSWLTFLACLPSGIVGHCFRVWSRDSAYLRVCRASVFCLVFAIKQSIRLFHPSRYQKQKAEK
jgi:hypothetical protein